MNAAGDRAGTALGPGAGESARAQAYAGAVARASGRSAVLLMLAAGVLASMALGSAIGSVRLPYFETLAIIVTKMLGLPYTFEASHEAIIWSVRLPRVVAAGLVGFALATCGAAMQGLFRNPLASPGITGVSSGASLGAAIALVFGWQFHFAWSVPATAFMGALIATALVYVMATRNGRTDIATLLLAGIAVNAFFSALVSLIYHFVEPGVLREIVYWLMGNLAGKRWEHVVTMLPFVLLGSLALMAFAPDLNAMVTGEDEARSLGVPVERAKRLVLCLVALVTGAAISVAGLIGFVGLIVPHMLRFVVGPDHRWLLPASGLGGASFLILCDLIARVAFNPIELRTGIVTAVFGVPFFLWLLVRSRETVRWE